jgi:hypothetical protein
MQKMLFVWQQIDAVSAISARPWLDKIKSQHPIPPGQNEHAVGICQIAQLKKVKL